MSTTLFRGGRVYSSFDPFATAIVVDAGEVAWVGSDAAASAHADGVDEIVELDGALVTPAFVDAHVHTTSTGLVLTGLESGRTVRIDVTITRAAAGAGTVTALSSTGGSLPVGLIVVGGLLTAGGGLLLSRTLLRNRKAA